ncbi:hypothetical protein QSU92_07750 [Microbacterium sp. ET2]|uniref:hypothetical protein n=1 Tax=Microbacterium albipurpureum TaxID=3050384 RepID=UPI00259D10EA|nr:hypothetical protein [Microbacterium sp. ET2 (Ac-2212)]WJL97047.1 hypothetical protein QSU92_07750 [Microbacterium sp. ET2 (Ac-2212)]
MMDLSFPWPHPLFDTPVGKISVRLHTFDNVFGIDPDSVRVTTTDDEGTRITADRLSWAGGQETAPGTLKVLLTPLEGELDVRVSATHSDAIRSIAVTIHDQPVGDIIGVREGRLSIPDSGRLLKYPDGWFDLASPLFAIDAPGSLAVRSLDDHPRIKRFAFIPDFRDTTRMNVELHVEADAQTAASAFDAPAWRISAGQSLDTLMERHRIHIQTAYAATEWGERADVPDWMHEVSLVVGLHGRHFTGYVFHDYAEMLDRLSDISAQIGGSRVLAYLPGWEGRYYRWYGRYGADPRLGGDDGYQRLIDGAHELGVHIMPMYGANIAARDLPGFERWGEPGILRTAGGFPAVGSVDWDSARTYDFAGGALINPAYAPWRAHLIDQISSNHQQFGFDAAFLDISAMHGNDPAGDTTEGLRALVDGIHAAIPGLMIGGEGWFDAIADHIPLVQAGHRHYVPTLHDEPDADLFTRTNRMFGHVSMGDPAFGSSGVHEAGWVDAWRLPVREGVIPTLNLVRDSISAAPDKVQRILEDARTYADLFAGKRTNEFLTDPH